MPHQCLHCGYIIEDSTDKHLRGCPKCQGHRFFFTKQLPTTSPASPATEASDVSNKVMNLIIEKHETLKNGESKWVSLTPKELRALVEQKLEQNTKKKTTPVPALTDEERRIRLTQHTTETPPHPETISIEQSGNYRIDLKGLLEKEPIVIQKDGTYTIHLPSAFQMLRKKHD